MFVLFTTCLLKYCVNNIYMFSILKVFQAMAIYYAKKEIKMCYYREVSKLRFSSVYRSLIQAGTIQALKYQFWKNVTSEKWNSDGLNTFTTYLSSLLGVIAIVFSNHAQKWRQICCESVQPVRVSFFQSDILSKLVLYIFHANKHLVLILMSGL